MSEFLSFFSIDSTAGFSYTGCTRPDLNPNETRNMRMSIEPKLAERLLALRTERGLTQEEAAEKIGVSNKTYSKGEDDLCQKISGSTN